jgi:hypothetical protein
MLLAKDPKQMGSDCERDNVWRKKVSMLEVKIVDVFLFFTEFMGFIEPRSWSCSKFFFKLLIDAPYFFRI